MSSVQHADLGVPDSSFQGLSEYTPHTPPARHTLGTTNATMTVTTDNPPSWRNPHFPREICITPSPRFARVLPVCGHLQVAALRLIADNISVGSPLLNQLNLATNQAMHIGRLMEDFQWALLFSKGAAPALQEDSFSIHSLAKEAMEVTRAMFPDTKVALQYDIDPAVPQQSARGFGSAASRVLFHLLHNGMKFTLTGSVRLQVMWRGTDAEPLSFTVTSTSPQIPPEKFAVLQQRYLQGDAPFQSDGSTLHGASLSEYATDGLGLGLYVASNLARLLGSGLELQSTSKCNVFEFTMPVKLPQPPRSCAEFGPQGAATSASRPSCSLRYGLEWGVPWMKGSHA